MQRQGHAIARSKAAAAGSHSFQLSFGTVDFWRREEEEGMVVFLEYGLIGRLMALSEE